MICSFLTVYLPEFYRLYDGIAADVRVVRSAADSIGGWPTFVSGIAVGALTIISAVVIAWRQRASQMRDRLTDRALEEARQREQELHKEKLAQREAWRADYEAIHRLLEQCEELAYHVRHEGPCTRVDFAGLGAATLRMNSERLAERGLPRLREPLLRLTQDLDCLTQHAIIDQLSLKSSHFSGQELNGIGLHEIQRTAILQDRAERDLTAHISSTWQILRDEWGG